MPKAFAMRRVSFLLLLLIVLSFGLFTGCGGKKQGGSDLTGVQSSSVSSMTLRSSSGSLDENVIGVFQVTADPQKGFIFKQLGAGQIHGKLNLLTDVESDTVKANIVFSGTAPATYCPGGATGGLCDTPVIATPTLRQNVFYTNNAGFPIYETKAVFYTWAPASAGLNNNTGGYGTLPITVTSTQLSPNTQAFAAWPNGYINMGDAASAGTSTTRLWIFDVPGGISVARYLLFEYRWRTQVSGTANNLNGIPMFDGSNGYACGNSGTILKTTDGGTNWVVQVSGTTQNLLDCSIGADISHAWAVGVNGTAAEGNIRMTTDGGANWVLSPSGTTQTLRGVGFANNSIGWAVGNSGTVRYTSDGGANWAGQASCSPGNRYRGVFSLTTTTAWIVGDNGIVCRTVDGGVNWLGPGVLSDGFTGNLMDAFFIDAATGWVVGNTGRIYKSVDGGANWVLQVSGTGSNLSGVTFKDSNNGWIAGAGAQLLHTTDGGTTWTLQDDGLGGAPAYNDISVKNDPDGNHQLWVVGNGGRLRTYK